MSGAASQCDTFDYKPATHPAQRREIRPRRQGRAVPEQSGRGDEEPVGMEAARPMRKMDQRPGAAHRLLRGRHRLRPFHGGEVERARSGHIHAEHRLRAARLPLHGLLGFLRPRQHESESADLRRASRWTRLRAQRSRKLERRLPARVAPGHHDPRQQRQSHLRSLSAQAIELHHAGQRGRHAGLCSAISIATTWRSAKAIPASKPASPLTKWPPASS